MQLVPALVNHIFGVVVAGCAVLVKECALEDDDVQYRLTLPPCHSFKYPTRVQRTSFCILNPLPHYYIFAYFKLKHIKGRAKSIFVDCATSSNPTRR